MLDKQNQICYNKIIKRKKEVDTMEKKFSYVIEVRHTFFTGYGSTYKEAEADAQRQALLYFWGQR